MTNLRTWTLLLVLGATTLAGCLDAEPGPQGDGADDGDDLLSTNATLEPLAGGLSADVSNGTAPLRVNVTLSAVGADANTTWSLEFGDGNTTDGTDLPATVNHTYEQTGNLTLVATFQRGNETASTNLTLTILAAAATGAPPPDVLEFSYADSLGCAGDVLAAAGQHCLSAGSPADSGIDGFWQELDERYWGLSFTTTTGNNLGDSDCFFTDADLTVVGSANNGGGPCAGDVPAGTAWLFLYSYAEPSTGQTLTFTL